MSSPSSSPSCRRAPTMQCGRGWVSSTRQVDNLVTMMELYSCNFPCPPIKALSQSLTQPVLLALFHVLSVTCADHRHHAAGDILGALHRLDHHGATAHRLPGHGLQERSCHSRVHDGQFHTGDSSIAYRRHDRYAPSAEHDHANLPITTSCLVSPQQNHVLVMKCVTLVYPCLLPSLVAIFCS